MVAAHSGREAEGVMTTAMADSVSALGAQVNGARGEKGQKGEPAVIEPVSITHFHSVLQQQM